MLNEERRRAILEILETEVRVLGVDGFDARFGLTSPSISEARVKQVRCDTTMLQRLRSLVACTPQDSRARGLAMDCQV